uniref:glucan endo-1,3-beta-glucosidase 8-like n=1 Tax=Erigeron canadensis TaxID=72917 RepID=UPI001CB986F0|nr:glucan endo-1,3-beta-glucosidase 8-like [Erigeron canadensis]
MAGEKMSRHLNLANLLIVCTLVLSIFASDVESLGVNWGTKSSHQLPPDTVVQMLKDNGFTKVKLFDADPNILNALADTDIEVMVGVKNVELDKLTEKINAATWVKKNVVRYVDNKVKITSVAVGNEPFLKDYKDMFLNSTRPALENIQNALDDAKLGDKIKASVPFNGDVYMSPPWRAVPSAGIFRPDVADEVEDIVDFLAKNKAPFIVNIFPFLSLTLGDAGFPIDYAFFDGDGVVQDGNYKYTNVFDANYDTCVSALKQIGHENMPIVVGEIGWPTDGNKWANTSLASRFYNGLLPRLAGNNGTHLRPGHIEVYLFGLLDEDKKSILPGDFERHWGIFDYAGQPKFETSLAGKDNNKTLVGAKNVGYQSTKWCILKEHESHDKKKLNESMTYACDRADCSAFADGGSCSGLHDADKTSYAINTFFQVANQSKASCDFGGIATEVQKDPSTGHCKFNIQIKPYDHHEDSESSPSPSPPRSSSSHFTSPRPAMVVLVILIMASLTFF